MDSLLTIVQNVCDEVGVPRPLSVVGSTDQTLRTILALANREGKELAARTSANEGWPQLRKEHTFALNVVTGVTGDTTNGSAVVSNLSSTASLAVGYGVIGTGIPFNTHILSIDSATQVTLDYAATATGTGVALTFGQDQYSFASDVQYYINRTGWDRTRKWELVGPVTPQEWQFLKSGYPATGFLYRYRIMGTKIFVDPIPQSVSNVVLEYYSKNWCQSAAGTTQSAWAADTDLPLLDDFLFTLGIKWRFLRSKGLDYAQEERTYEDAVERTMARYATSRDLAMNSSSGRVHRLVDYRNVSDGGFGTTT